MSTDLAKLVVRLEAEIGKYSENLNKAQRQLDKFASDTDKRLQGLGNKIVAFFAVERLAAWGDRILENADAMGKFAQSAGISVESFSRLQYAFETNNVEAESFSKIMKDLNKNLSEAAGNSKSDAAQAFRALGIEVKTATGEIRKGDDVLLDIADRFESYEDGANKSAIATALLGKAGVAAIPGLNAGADGLRELGDEAERVGRVISEDLAEQADQFNDRLDRMKSILVDGLGNKIAADLLPSLNALGKELEGDGEQLKLLDVIASASATTLRGLTDIALGISTSFAKLGNAIGASAAAAVQAAQLNFDKAGEIWRDATEDNLKLEADYQKLRAGLWKKTDDEIVQEVTITAKKLKEQAPNLAGGKELQEAAQKAIDKLRDMKLQLDEQVATFDMGEAAAIKYRLEIGNLKDEVAAAGEGGKKLAESIIAQAEAFERLKNAKEVAKALDDINAQILELQGNSAEAAIAQLDAKNAELVKKLRESGNEAGLKQLDTLTKLVVAQADFNAETQKAERIQADLDRVEQRLRNSRESGAITDMDFQEQLSEARQKAIKELGEVADAQQKIAEQTGNPEMIDNVNRLTASIEDLKAQSELAAASIRKGFEESFGDALKMTVKNIRDADDAFKGFVDSVIDQLLDLATKASTQQLFNFLFGSADTQGGSNGSGAFFNALAGIFGGGAATGRDVEAGMAYQVNERTPNSEWFVPDTPGRVVPLEKMGGTQQTNYFTIQAPKGTVSRQTEMQIAAAASTGLARASRRNS